MASRIITMTIRIRRIDKTLPLPAHQTDGAVAFDLMAREGITSKAKEVAYVPLNVAIEPPKDHMVLIAPRSSLHKRGLFLANSIGIGDRDFSGNDDEYHAAIYNYTDRPVTIYREDRIVQGIFVSYKRANWEEVDDLENPSRGGFGTTGI